MQSIKYTTSQKAESFLLNIIKYSSFISLTFSLVSCGGGGGGGGSTATAAITSLSRSGVVAPYTGSIGVTGTNFSNGMSISVTDSNGGTYTSGNTTFSNTNLMSTNISITTAPTEKYLTVTVKSSSGTTLSSTVLGVASVAVTLASDIQPILNTYCTGCHDGTQAGAPDFQSINSASTNNLINAKSTGCSNKLRVTAGDPRPSSSVLINKVEAYINSTSPCAGYSMPKLYVPNPPLTPAFTQTQVTTMIEWIAGGVH